MNDKLLDRFRSVFWDAFHAPDLTTEKFKKIWEESEPLNDQIAGPLFSVYENANCNYIFEDNERFPSIKQPEDLFERLTDAIKEYGEKVASNPTESEEEENDLKILLFQADIKMELAELALQILEQNKK